jgi:hypothetical protein
MIHLIRDGSQARVYINGNLRDMRVSDSGGSVSGANRNLVIAADRKHERHFDGKLDEVRISDKARDESWITTSYNTMNNPSSFLTFGPEESGP